MSLVKEKIYELLATESPENQQLALELIQSQWQWTWEESVLFLLEYYCSNNTEKLSLAIENITVSYHLEFMEDYCANAMRGVTELVFEVKDKEKILLSEQLDSCNSSINQNPILEDYKNVLKNHLEYNLPNLSKINQQIN